MAARVEVPLAKLGSSLAAMKKIAADLAQSPPSEDELARAKNPRLDDFAKARETNGYWISELSGAQTDARRLEILRGVIAATEKVSATDVQQAARDILKADSAWTLTIVPEARQAPGQIAGNEKGLANRRAFDLCMSVGSEDNSANAAVEAEATGE